RDGEQRLGREAPHGRDGEERHHEVPLGQQEERGEQALRRLVERLEEAASPGAVVDAPAPAADGAVAAAVDAAAPGQVAAAVVLLRPLALEQRLGAPVAALLAEERADRVAPPVPD